MLGEHLAESIGQALVQREDGLYARGARVGPDHLLARTLAQHGRERIDDDRLARARLARQHVEAGCKIQSEVIDDGKIRNGQFA